MDDTLYKYHFVQNEALLLNETPLLPSLSISVLSQVKTLSIPCYTLRERERMASLVARRTMRRKWPLLGRVCSDTRGFRSSLYASEGSARVSKLPRQLTVYVPPHPLVKHYLSMARNEMTPPQLFRGALAVRSQTFFFFFSIAKACRKRSDF